MAVWDTLKIEIARALDEHPHALVGYPDPRSDRGRDPPLSLELAPWATEVARSFHDRFGADVHLQVGALSYPEAVPARPSVPELGPELDPGEVGVALDEPVEVRSGYTAHAGLRVWNRADRALHVVTNGGVTAYVVEPGTGAIVGGFSGAQRVPRVTFRIMPLASEVVPLLVGTASFVPDLGYAVPPGSWEIRVPMELDDGRRMTTPGLAITVTA